MKYILCGITGNVASSQVDKHGVLLALLDNNTIFCKRKVVVFVLPNNVIRYKTADSQSISYKETLEGLMQSPLGAAYTGPSVLSETYNNESGYWEIKFSEDVDVIKTSSTDATMIFCDLSGFGGPNISQTVIEYHLPDGVTEIGELAFLNNAHLWEINIPNGVTTIGQQAFMGCTGLTNIVIPNSVTSIGNGAFLVCSGLTNITIGSGVTTIGASVFNSCSRLKNVVIPDSVTSIGGSSFYECTRLESITLSNNLTSIDNSEFYGCTSLSSIDIPDSVTTIGETSFMGCTGLTSVTIGSGVTSIGACAFQNCSGLTSITIPNGVTSIGNYAFKGCSGLGTINYGGTMNEWKSITKGESWYDGIPATTVHCSDGDLTGESITINPTFNTDDDPQYDTFDELLG